MTRSAYNAVPPVPIIDPFALLLPFDCRARMTVTLRHYPLRPHPFRFIMSSMTIPSSFAYSAENSSGIASPR